MNDGQASADTLEISEIDEPATGSSSKKILIIGLLLVVVSAGAGWWFFTADSGTEVEQKEGDADEIVDEHDSVPPPIYQSLDPPLIVNIEPTNKVQFLQVSLEVMATDMAVIEGVKTHMPAIRNSLLLLLSNQTYDTLSDSAGKQKLRIQILDEIKTILDASHSPSDLQAVYFTGFVMQ
jgi:flagellar protein FliL